MEEDFAGRMREDSRTVSGLACGHWGKWGVREVARSNISKSGVKGKGAKGCMQFRRHDPPENDHHSSSGRTGHPLERPQKLGSFGKSSGREGTVQNKMGHGVWGGGGGGLLGVRTED